MVKRYLHTVLISYQIIKIYTWIFLNKISHGSSTSSVKTCAVLKFVQNKNSWDKYVNKTYNQVVKQFRMLLFAQFRRVSKSTYHIENPLAHREQIQISKSKQAIQLIVSQDTNITDEPKHTIQNTLVTVESTQLFLVLLPNVLWP